MSPRLALASVVFALSFASDSVVAADGDLVWLTDLDAAQAQARTENKLVMMNFTGSNWCPYCIQLKKEVFDTDAFKDWARQKVVLVEVDFPTGTPIVPEVAEAREALKNRFKVEGFPTLVFLDPDGYERGRAGYTAGGPKAWLNRVNKQVHMFDGNGVDQNGWMIDLELAKQRARKEGRPILAAFTTDKDCAYCPEMRREILEHDDFLDWADANVILLEVRFSESKTLDDAHAEQNRELAERLGVTDFPTVVFLDSNGKAKGKPLGYVTGGPEHWLPEARKLGGNRKPKKRAAKGT